MALGILILALALAGAPGGSGTDARITPLPLGPCGLDEERADPDQREVEASVRGPTASSASGQF